MANNWQDEWKEEIAIVAAMRAEALELAGWVPVDGQPGMWQAPDGQVMLDYYAARSVGFVEPGSRNTIDEWVRAHRDVK